MLFGGSSSGISGNKTEPSKGGSDFWLLELSADLGIEEEGVVKHLSVYPNPASNSFTISKLNPETTYNLVILNSTGQKVIESKVNASNHNVDIDMLDSGVYAIQLFDGELKYFSRIVVK